MLKLSSERHLNQHIVALHKPDAVAKAEDREKKNIDHRKSAEQFAGSLGAQKFGSYFKVAQRGDGRGEVRS